MKKHSIPFAALTLFAVSVALYLNTLSHDFAFDDKSLIVENPLVQTTASPPALFSTNYRHGVGFTDEGLYRPLTMLTFVYNSPVDPSNPFPYHFFNVIVNACTVVAAYFLLRRVTGHDHISFYASLVFAFHPLHTEAVANIAGRPELLWTLFALLAWLSAERDTPLSSLVSAFLFLCALLSKETAVIFPIFVFSADCIRKRPCFGRRRIHLYALFAMTLIGYFSIRHAVLGGSFMGNIPDFSDNPIASAPHISRMATAFSVWARYLLLLVFPVRLSADYSYHHLPVYSSFAHITPIIGLALFLGLIVTLIISWNTHPVYSIGVVVLLLPYLIISNIIFPVGTMLGERLMYFPILGLSLCSVSLIFRIHSRWKSYVYTAGWCILILFGVRSILRNANWENDNALFSHDITVAPNSAKVQYNMGYLTSRQGLPLSAEHYYRRAVEILPTDVLYLRGLAKNLYDQQRYDEAVIYYGKALMLSPGTVSLMLDYGIALEIFGKIDDAHALYEKARLLAPDDPRPYENIGHLLIITGHPDQAPSFLLEALQREGDIRKIYTNLATAYYLVGDIPTAHTYLSAATLHGFTIHPELADSIQALYNSLDHH